VQKWSRVPRVLSNLQNSRDEMRFRLMRFPLSGREAQRVEITQAGIAQAVNLVEPCEHALTAVSIRRSVGGRSASFSSIGVRSGLP